MGWTADKIRDAPSGWTHIWKFWRHCCCRYGWWPILVALVCTSALLVDLYSSLSCQFLQVNVGFNPSNTGWNESSANIGIFFYESGSLHYQFGDNIVEGCVRYSDEFEQQFIDGDKTWVATQIMAMVAAISGMIATVVAWLLVVTPIPSCFIWPGVLLPSVMLAFLAEGSKFLFFDVSICHAPLWYPGGAESMPQIARSCTLGTTGYYIIASTVVFFVGLVMICLRAPELRTLKEHYGDSYRDSYMVNAQELHSGSLTEDPEEQLPAASLESIREEEGDEEDRRSLKIANTSMVMSMSQEDCTPVGSSQSQEEYHRQSEISFQPDSAEDFSTYPLQRMVSEDSQDGDSGLTRRYSSTSRQASKESSSDSYLHALAAKVSGAESEYHHSFATTKKTATQSQGNSNTMQHSDELIDKCVTELEQSFIE